MSRSLYSLFSLVLFTALTLSHASADPNEAPKGEASIGSVQGELTFILAAKQPANMDKRLEHMAKDLRRAFAGRFRSFRFHKGWKPQLKSGETKEYSLPGGGVMKMSFKEREGPYLRLYLDMPDWSGVVRVRDGKRFFHAGRKHGDDTLIVGLKLASPSTK